MRNTFRGDFRINFPTPLHLACANDELRPAMQCVAFDNNFAVATDAHMLIRQSFDLFHPVLAENAHFLNGKFLHRKAFARIYKEYRIEIQEKGIQSKDKDGNIFFYPYSNGPDEQNFLGETVVYPKYQVVLDQAFANCKNSKINYGLIGMNANVIDRLHKVMHYEGLNGGMRFYLPSTPHSAILVEATSVSRDLQVGIVMPVLVDIGSE